MALKKSDFPSISDISGDHIITTSNNTCGGTLNINACKEIPIETLKNDELLITITGLTGSGKSTMAELIRELIDLYGVEVDDRTEIAQREKYGHNIIDRETKMKRVCAVMNRLKRVVIIEENGNRNFAR